MQPLSKKAFTSEHHMPRLGSRSKSGVSIPFLLNNVEKEALRKSTFIKKGTQNTNHKLKDIGP